MGVQFPQPPQIFKFMKKKIILISLIIVAVIITVYLIFLRHKNNTISVVEVKRGDIVEKVFESGQVRSGEKINLNFKNSGQIEAIYVAVGDQVEIGQPLAKIDTTELEIKLKEARASLEAAQLNLDKLIDTNHQTILQTAEENLKNNYNSAIVVLDASYPQIYNTLDFVKGFIRTYISTLDQDARKIIDIKNQIETQQEKAKPALDKAKQDLSNYPEIDNVLLTMKDSLENVFNSLETMRKIISDSSFYSNSVSLTDQNLLSTYKTNINSALNQIINIQKTISASKLELRTYQIDVDLYQAQIKQAEAQVQLYENQLKEATLVSPVKGKITEIKKKPGELVQPLLQEATITILPEVSYEVKVDIYEENIVKVKVGDPVEISLVSFPNRTFKGQVISINPAEKVIQDVVYYEVIIGFQEFPEGIKPGMTADVAIQTGFKKDVLVIPKNLVQKKEGKTIVQVLKNGSFEEREIIIGSQGINDLVEIISGLNEGERAVKP